MKNTPIEWVASALDNKDIGEPIYERMSYMYSHRDGYLYASNSMLCFRTKNHNFEQGRYFHPKTFKDMQGSSKIKYFPVEDLFNYEVGDLYFSNAVEEIISGDIFADIEYLAYSPTGAVFDKELIDKATNGELIDGKVIKLKIHERSLRGENAFGEFIVTGHFRDKI